MTFRWDRLANKLGSHAGGRKQKRTTDATRREIPMIAMVRGSGTVRLRGMCAWECQAVESVVDNLTILGAGLEVEVDSWTHFYPFWVGCILLRQAWERY